MPRTVLLAVGAIFVLLIFLLRQVVQLGDDDVLLSRVVPVVSFRDPEASLQLTHQGLRSFKSAVVNKGRVL